MKKLFLLFTVLGLAACSPKTDINENQNKETLELEKRLLRFIPTIGIEEGLDEEIVNGLVEAYPGKDLDYYSTNKKNPIAIHEGRLYYYSKDNRENNKTELYEKFKDIDSMISALKEEGLIPNNYFLKEEAGNAYKENYYLLFKDQKARNYGDYICLTTENGQLVKAYVEDSLVLEDQEIQPKISQEEAEALVDDQLGENRIIGLIIQNKAVVEELKDAKTSIDHEDFVLVYSLADENKVFYIDAMDGKILYDSSEE